jgi:hypothetical protein
MNTKKKDKYKNKWHNEQIKIRKKRIGNKINSYIINDNVTIKIMNTYILRI